MKKNKLKIVEIPPTGKAGWGGGAYSHVFVYSKYNGNFLVKGYHKEVMDYLNKNHTHYFCNITLFGGGTKRNFWKFWKDTPYVRKPNTIYNETRKYKISKSYFNDMPNDIILKRMPNKWIKEFNVFY